jgi:hypothetical protein
MAFFDRTDREPQDELGQPHGVWKRYDPHTGRLAYRARFYRGDLILWEKHIAADGFRMFHVAPGILPFIAYYIMRFFETVFSALSFVFVKLPARIIWEAVQGVMVALMRFTLFILFLVVAGYFYVEHFR